MTYLRNIFFILSLCSCSILYNKLGGDFSGEPTEWENELSQGAKDLVAKAYEGVDPKKVVDLHMHVVGLGNSGSKIWVNPNMQKWWKHLGKYNRFNVYLSASGVEDKEKADEQYIERLKVLSKNVPMIIKSHILAFDYHYKKNGEIDYHHSEFYVPNEYIMKIAKENPDLFVPVVSVHPYKKDAVKELEGLAKMGARHVKWLPNAMGMDPSDKDIIPYYKVMKKYNMTLLSHTGEEKAVEGEAFQELANPLRLKLPLNLGVKVMMAHMSSRGKCQDYENENVVTECSDLFWRMFKDKKYEKLLFSEMSGLLIHERIGAPMDLIIENEEYQTRVGYGSDYPLPAINFIYRTGQLENLGYITKEERGYLNEIYKLNPLLFHFVSLRTVKHPKTKKRLTIKAFESPIQ